MTSKGTPGNSVVLVVPLPSWPTPLAPQHLTSPVESSAQEWVDPPLTETASERGFVQDASAHTSTGTDVGVALVIPFPNWP